MSDIFISYASDDRERIMPLVRALENTGWSVFWDRTIPTGKHWRQVIGIEIDECSTMIVVWSKNSLDSKFVMQEAAEGQRREILFPVVLDNIIPPFGFREEQAQDLSGWDGTVPYTAFDRLVNDMKKLLGESPIIEKAEAKRKAEEKEWFQKEEEAKRKAAEEEQKNTEAEAKRKAEEEKRKQKEEEAKRRAAEEEAKRKAAEEETKRKVEDKERQQQEQIAALYKQAQEQARLHQWEQAQEKMKEIQALDSKFVDPKGISTRAEKGLKKKAELLEHERLKQKAQAKLIREDIEREKEDETAPFAKYIKDKISTTRRRTILYLILALIGAVVILYFILYHFYGFRFDKEKAFLKAAENNDIKLIQKLIVRGVDVDAYDKDGFPALIVATRWGKNVDTIKELINAGAHVNIGDSDGWTALMHAARTGNVDIIKELINAGADMNIKDSDGNTALMHAAEYGEVITVKELINASADINTQDSLGETALMHALTYTIYPHFAGRANLGIIKVLIKASADIHKQDNLGRTALINAAFRQESYILKELINAGADINKKESLYGWTALMCAARTGNVNVIKELINAGAHVNIGDSDGRTALMHAAEYGEVITVKELINASADMNIKDSDGRTALMIAHEKGHTEVVNILRNLKQIPKKKEEVMSPVSAIGEIKPPKLLREVPPVYPEDAWQAGIEGDVIIEATTDIYGRVQNIKVLKSIPSLDQAAIDAVKQWVYEPMIINGRKRRVIFVVTVSFRLK